MNRFTLTVAAAALLPAAAFAESHAAQDTTDPMADPAPMVEADKNDPAAEPMQTVDRTDPMMPKPEGSEMAKHDGKGTTGLLAPVKASVIIGSPIYTLSASGEATWDPETEYGAVADSWTRIGSIDDFIVGENGEITGLVAEVGGFLGIGDAFVMLPLEDTKMVMVTESSYAVVTPYSSEQLEGMERVD